MAWGMTSRPDLIHIPIKLLRYPKQLLGNGVYKSVWNKINQRGISQKLRKGKQSFLCVTCRPDLIHIPIKLPRYPKQ